MGQSPMLHQTPRGWARMLPGRGPSRVFAGRCADRHLCPADRAARCRRLAAGTTRRRHPAQPRGSGSAWDGLPFLCEAPPQAVGSPGTT